jgi:spore coat polysaccharide biosynthesis predicted glycosyltransferase SpsG
MSEVMAKTDMAVCACGSTVYEFSSLGVPAVGIVTADNQKRLYKAITNDGLIIGGGYIDSFDESAFLKGFAELFYGYDRRKNMSAAMLRTVKTDGAERLAKGLYDLFN